MFVRNATSLLFLTMETVRSITAKHIMTTNVSPVNVDSSLLPKVFASPWITAAYAIREDSVPIVSLTSD